MPRLIVPVPRVVPGINKDTHDPIRDSRLSRTCFPRIPVPLSPPTRDNPGHAGHLVPQGFQRPGLVPGCPATRDKSRPMPSDTVRRISRTPLCMPCDCRAPKVRITRAGYLPGGPGSLTACQAHVKARVGFGRCQSPGPPLQRAHPRPPANAEPEINAKPSPPTCRIADRKRCTKQAKRRSPV